MAGIILKYWRTYSFILQELQFWQASNKIQPFKTNRHCYFDQQKEKFNYEYRHLNTLKDLVLQPTESSLELQFFGFPNIQRKYTTATGLRSKANFGRPRNLTIKYFCMD